MLLLLCCGVCSTSLRTADTKRKASPKEGRRRLSLEFFTNTNTCPIEVIFKSNEQTEGKLKHLQWASLLASSETRCELISGPAAVEPYPPSTPDKSEHGRSPDKQDVLSTKLSWCQPLCLSFYILCIRIWMRVSQGWLPLHPTYCLYCWGRRRS